MKTVAAERRRFGYRRIHIMLERQGIVMKQKELQRLYREERKRGGPQASIGNQQANGRTGSDERARRFRVLAVVDDFTRECLALVRAAPFDRCPLSTPPLIQHDHHITLSPPYIGHKHN